MLFNASLENYRIFGTKYMKFYWLKNKINYGLLNTIQLYE